MKLVFCFDASKSLAAKPGALGSPAPAKDEHHARHRAALQNCDQDVLSPFPRPNPDSRTAR
jgi:hypothetical protein